jgi:hypothetical protein
VLLLRGEQNPAGHQIERAALVFKHPFAPGSRAAIAGSVYRADDRTLFIVGLHGFGEDGAPQPRPSVFGRLEGRLDVKRGDPRFAA